MAVNLSPIGGVAAQFLDNSGNLLSGGKIYTYAAGTTTPQATYTSSSGATAHSNPIILDAAGRVPSGEIWLTDGFQYKFLIKTSTDVQIGSYDNIAGINANFVNYTTSQEFQTATAGQTVFTLTTMAYQPGTNSLSVFVDGVNQYGPGAIYAYQETNSTSVTFTSGLPVGAKVKFTTSAINASSYGDAEQISYTPPFTGSVPTNVEAKLAQTVSVMDFGAVGDGIADDTAAIQAAINSFALVGAYNPANVTGVTIIMNGTFLTGPLTFPVNTPYRLEVSGGLKLTAGTTLTIPREVTIYGKSGSLTSQFSFQSPGCLIVGSETSDPVVSVTDSRGKCLENVVIAPPKFVGLLISGFSTLNALCKLKNVSCTARAGVITSKPFVAETTFWLAMEDCSFMGLTGSSPYSMEFLQSAGSTSGSYNGLIYAHNLNVNSGGIYIQSSANSFSSNFKFENLQIENIVPGGSLVTIDNTSTSFISDITLIRPQLFDNVGSTAYLINNIGNSNVRRINIQEFDLNQGAIVNPTSTNFSGIVVDGFRGFPYSFEISGLPALDSLYTRSFSGAMDTILTTANRTATTVPVTPLLVEQSPTQWGALASGGATVTTGILAPDGSLNAGQVGGANGGLVTLYGIATSVALNDWFIVGYWAQSAEASKMPTNARLDLAVGGWYVNGTSSTAAEIGRDYEPFAVNDQGWKWVCQPVKITTAGTGSPSVRLYLRRDTAYGLTNYFMPGVIHIPASLGFTDAEVVALSRSLQAWPSGSVSGDLTVLPHQTLRLGGGVGVFSASANPSTGTGTWKRGDVVFNTAPSAGGVPGWVCVAAGTPGTWRAMANLA